MTLKTVCTKYCLKKPKHCQYPDRKIVVLLATKSCETISLNIH